jgi:hypothetical protein
MIAAIYARKQDPRDLAGVAPSVGAVMIAWGVGPNHEQQLPVGPRPYRSRVRIG